MGYGPGLPPPWLIYLTTLLKVAMILLRIIRSMSTRAILALVVKLPMSIWQGNPSASMVRYDSQRTRQAGLYDPRECETDSSESGHDD